MGEHEEDTGIYIEELPEKTKGIPRLKFGCNAAVVAALISGVCLLLSVILKAPDQNGKTQLILVIVLQAITTSIEGISTAPTAQNTAVQSPNIPTPVIIVVTATQPPVTGVAATPNSTDVTPLPTITWTPSLIIPATMAQMSSSTFSPTPCSPSNTPQQMNSRAVYAKYLSDIYMGCGWTLVWKSLVAFGSVSGAQPTQRDVQCVGQTQWDKFTCKSQFGVDTYAVLSTSLITISEPACIGYAPGISSISLVSRENTKTAQGLDTAQVQLATNVRAIGEFTLFVWCDVAWNTPTPLAHPSLAVTSTPSSAQLPSVMATDLPSIGNCENLPPEDRWLIQCSYIPNGENDSNSHNPQVFCTLKIMRLLSHFSISLESK